MRALDRESTSICYSQRRLRECAAEKEELQKTLDEISQRNIQLEFENQDLSSKLEESESFIGYSCLAI
jgi:regulator of replication initiation timing